MGSQGSGSETEGLQSLDKVINLAQSGRRLNLSAMVSHGTLPPTTVWLLSTKLGVFPNESRFDPAPQSVTTSLLGQAKNKKKVGKAEGMP